MPRRKPYEFLAPPRAELEQLYSRLVRARLIPAAHEEVDFWAETLAKQEIKSQPSYGWTQLAYDLRIVNLGLRDRVEKDQPGRSARSKQMKNLASALQQAAREIADLSMDPEVIAAALSMWGGYQPPVTELFKISNSIHRLAVELEARPNKPRWREAAMRELRVEMACCIAPVFRQHFGQDAIPGGGSHFRDLSDCNDWTKFFQAVANAFWDERVTPDRQAILWEAASQPVDLPSDIRAFLEQRQSDSGE